jgi:branched-chain amino acid transport system ATP-binding protein
MNNPSPALDVLLRCSGLTRRWGGLVAVSDVAVELVRGTVHAVIGTNGAGKSTLINMLSGEIAPSGGRIELMGQDVTQWTQPRRARAGLGRSYQRNTIYPRVQRAGELPLDGTVSLAEALAPGGRAPATCADSHASPHEAAASVGLSESWTWIGRDAVARPASASWRSPCAWPPRPRCCCSTSRWPAWAPKRPSACWSLLASLRRHHAILLVEHDMDAVFRISDRITVMVNGAVIASGSPDAVRRDDKVQSAYLGEH